MRETLDGILDLVLWRDGGQRQARRNAWASMVADNVRARDRVAADDAVQAAIRAADRPVSSTHGARGEGRYSSNG